MNNKSFSLKCYQHFAEKEGNQHIAGLFALEKILDIIKLNKPKGILEVGLGIGSISYTILKYFKESGPKVIYKGTEANEFCLKALKENLEEFYEDLDIYENLEHLQNNEKFDFVIIDGSDDSLEKIKALISEHGVIFIEGHRAQQVEKINSIFPKHKHTTCISDFKNPSFGPFSSKIWSGGGQLIYVNPTSRQYLHYYSEKIKTSFKYRVKRKIKLLKGNA